MSIPGTTMKSSNVLDLKNPFFRYTGQQTAPPPGNNHTSPTDAYWSQQDAAAGSLNTLHHCLSASLTVLCTLILILFIMTLNLRGVNIYSLQKEALLG